MRRVPYDSLLRQASLSYPSAQLKRNAYGGMVGWPHWHVIIWGRLVVNWILEKVFSLLDSVFLSFLRWGKNFPLFGELLLTTTPFINQKVIRFESYGSIAPVFKSLISIKHFFSLRNKFIGIPVTAEDSYNINASTVIIGKDIT